MTTCVHSCESNAMVVTRANSWRALEP